MHMSMHHTRTESRRAMGLSCGDACKGCWSIGPSTRGRRFDLGMGFGLGSEPGTMPRVEAWLVLLLLHDSFRWDLSNRGAPAPPLPMRRQRFARVVRLLLYTPGGAGFIYLRTV